jgi:outer membrane protein TolC
MQAQAAESSGYAGQFLCFLERRILRQPAGIRFVFVLGGLVFFGGCAAGPNFHRPAAPAVKGYTPEPLVAKTAQAEVAGGEAQRFVQGLDIPGQWRRLFHSRPLNTLIEEALKANPSLASAQAALRVARENALAQKGAYYPTSETSFSPSYNKTATGSLSAASALGNPYYSLQTCHAGRAGACPYPLHSVG